METAKTQNLPDQYIELLSSNIAAVSSLAATIRSTLGPKGMDVMMVDQYGDYLCTNDGVEILSNIELSHPAAKLTVDVAKAQELRAGDGTTSVTIMTDAILNNALTKVKEGFAPIRLVKGIELAIDEAIKELKSKAETINNAQDPELEQITRVSARGNKEITELLVNAAQKLDQNLFLNKEFHFDRLVHAAQAKESKVVDGYFIKKKPHFQYTSKLKDANILIVEGAFEPEAIPAESIQTDTGVNQYNCNVETLKESAKRVAQAGVNAIFVDASMFQQLEEFFSKENIFVLTHVRKEDLKTLAKSSGAQMISRETLFNSNKDQITKLCGKANELYFDNDLSGVFIDTALEKLCSVFISAETKALLDERYRIAIDGAKALQCTVRGGYLLGEGLAELSLIPVLQKLKSQHSDAGLQAGIEIVESSLDSIFKQIMINAGFDPELCLGKIQNQDDLGIDTETGSTINLKEAGILDPLEVKTNILKISKEICCQVLKINLVLKST